MSRAHVLLHPAALLLQFAAAAPFALMFACGPKYVPREFADVTR